MRIDRLDLIAYGPFTDTSVDLSRGSSGLHLIYGDNEAGKSTSLRALIAWLFGIPTRTSDNFLHDNKQLRIGGRLSLSDGRWIEFVRRKGNKGTLLGVDGSDALDDSVLEPFLPVGIDADLFTKLYGIDHDRLVAGGQELLSESGDMGQALFSAAVGTAGLRKILSDLQEEADALFAPRASTRVVNKANTAFKDARKRVKAASLSVKEWKALRQELDEAVAQIDQVDGESRKMTREHVRLARLSRVKSALAERRSVVERLKEMGDVLVLPEDFDERRRIVSGDLKRARVEKERAEAKRMRIEEEARTLDVRKELLDNEADILSLHKELGAVEKSRRDRPQQEGKRRMLRSEAETILKGIRPDVAMEDVNGLRRILNNKKWIAGLARAHAGLNQKKEKAEVTLTELEDARAAAKKDLGQGTPRNLDLKDLKAAVAAARKSGDLDGRLAEAKRRAREEQAGCESRFTRLGRFSESVEALSKVALPVSETLDLFEKQFGEIEERIRDCRRKLGELDEEREASSQDLEALLRKSDVPTVSQLKEVRALRDRAWMAIRGKFIEHREMDGTMAEFAANADLPLFYERQVAAADRVSDLIRTEADKVVKRADFEVSIQRATSRGRDQEEAIRKADEDRHAIEKEWNAVWTPLGIEPGTPREMKQWMVKAEGIIEHFGVVQETVAEAQRVAEEYETNRASMLRRIMGFDEAIDTSSMTLDAMISLCEERVEEEEAARIHRRESEHTLADAEKRLNRTREELRAIEAEQAGWQQEWAQAIDGLGLGPTVHPEHAVETFDRLAQFFEKFDRSEELKKRIEDMQQVEDVFDRRVLEFAERIGFHTDGLKASAIVGRLYRDVSRTREDRASLQKIEKHREDVIAEIENADITIRTAQKELADLMIQARVSTEKDLELACDRSKKKREEEKRLLVLERELVRSGDALSIEELEQEAAESDMDAVEGELVRVSSELQELQNRRDVLRDRRQAILDQIDAKDGSSLAAEASQEGEELLATIVSGAEQYLRLRIAALVLGQRIEAYRKQHQAPVLARAGELFARLTLGSYVKLRDEVDEGGRPILLGVRPNEMEVAVDGMSDGSRDQLYLALRLATLDQHLGRTEPMPFVVDDILIGFDDHRTKVCLEVLADLASRTQVLLFTHHLRVVELAGDVHNDAGIFIHELPAPTQTGRGMA
ncbi:MAG: AAA family ATPase [Deltaproteobacteria bacterium]|nr:AAA family ATPase [Deltaproteobacteria bacterium]